MSGANQRFTCDECRIYSPGWHYDDDGNPSPCPNKLAAKAADEIRSLVDRVTSTQREEAKKAARQIVADAAHCRPSFSANDIDEELEAARIPGSLVGGAFTWAASEGLIVQTDRMVRNRKKTTRKPIHEWESLVYRAGKASA